VTVQLVCIAETKWLEYSLPREEWENILLQPPFNFDTCKVKVKGDYDRRDPQGPDCAAFLAHYATHIHPRLVASASKRDENKLNDIKTMFRLFWDMSVILFHRRDETELHEYMNKTNQFCNLVRLHFREYLTTYVHDYEVHIPQEWKDDEELGISSGSSVVLCVDFCTHHFQKSRLILQACTQPRGLSTSTRLSNRSGSFTPITS
jgi:hypothetical protein